MRVTTDDLLEAMRVAMAQPDADEDGLTGPELMAKLGMGRPNFTRCLKQMLATGRAEVVTVQRKGMDGRTMTLRGYRLKRKLGRAA